MPGLLAGQERLELLATDCGPPTGWPDPIGGNCTRSAGTQLTRLHQCGNHPSPSPEREKVQRL